MDSDLGPLFLMAIKLTTEQFIENSKKIFGDSLDYSETIYINRRSKVKLICKKHGEFEQWCTNHFKGHECSKCRGEKMSLLMCSNTQEFTNKAIIKFGYKYDYSKVDYKNNTTPVIIGCTSHGNFLQNPADHLSGKGCFKCHKDKMSEKYRDTTENFIEKAKNIHEDKYDYSKTIYGKNGEDKVTIICPIHGDFEQSPENHLYGSGCRECSFQYNTHKRSDWITKAKQRKGTFYIIRCWNEDEEFFKFGITFNGTKSRYSRQGEMPYNYKIIREIKSHDLGYIWDLEKRFGRTKRNNRYNPKIDFGGSMYECFKQ